jgi:aminopeptidase N
MRLRPLLPVLAALAVGCASSDDAPSLRSAEAMDAAAATIRAEDVIARIGVLADDSMRGRRTPSPELDMVAEWIAGEFAEMGLEPGGDDGSFVQRYPLPNGEEATAPNVVGILPGSDPVLRD